MNSREIIGFLHDRYYLENGTPEQMVSSLWRRFQKSFEVAMGDGSEIETLKGDALGFVHRMTMVGKLVTWATIISYFGILDSRRELIGLLTKGVSLAHKMGVPFSYDCFRQICTFHLLIRHNKSLLGGGILIIGDGFGFLSAFIKEMLPQAKLTLIDLGRTLLFQAHHCAKVHPNMVHCLP